MLGEDEFYVSGLRELHFGYSPAFYGFN
jgi:hypothetical protein